MRGLGGTVDLLVVALLLVKVVSRLVAYRDGIKGQLRNIVFVLRLWIIVGISLASFVIGSSMEGTIFIDSRKV